jgi:fluoroacetyl-CoA thioesterase
MPEIVVGLRGQVVTRVTADQTAAALGSGDVPAFGTPALVALVEAAAVNALAGRLAPDETTVGTRLEVTHLAATPVGAEVRAEAALVAVEGRKLTFTVIAYDDRGTIGEGRHERMLLSRDRFLAKLAAAR